MRVALTQKASVVPIQIVQTAQNTPKARVSTVIMAAVCYSLIAYSTLLTPLIDVECNEQCMFCAHVSTTVRDYSLHFEKCKSECRDAEAIKAAKQVKAALSYRARTSLEQMSTTCAPSNNIVGASRDCSTVTMEVEPVPDALQRRPTSYDSSKLVSDAASATIGHTMSAPVSDPKAGTSADILGSSTSWDAMGFSHLSEHPARAEVLSTCTMDWNTDHMGMMQPMIDLSPDNNFATYDHFNPEFR
jgi:hypothetical protein